MEVKIVSEHIAELLINLPPNTLLDRTGYLSIRGITKLMADAHTEAEKKGFMTLALKNSALSAYRVRSRTIYPLNSHSRISSKDGNILLRLSLTSVGTSSLCFCLEVMDPCSKELLVRADTKDAMIDPSIRGSYKLPQWFLDKWAMYSSLKAPPNVVKQEAFMPPKDAFRTIIITRYSDIDHNGHVNLAEYYRFCMDCAYEASLSAFYRHYNENLILYPVLETDVTFFNELLPLLKLNVFTWQDHVDIQKIYFAIYKNESRVFQASYLYGLLKSHNSKL